MTLVVVQVRSICVCSIKKSFIFFKHKNASFVFLSFIQFSSSLTQSKSNGGTHRLVHFHVDHGFRFFLGTGGGGGSSALGGFIICTDGGGVEVIHLDGFDANNILIVAVVESMEFIR